MDAQGRGAGCSDAESSTASHEPCGAGPDPGTEKLEQEPSSAAAAVEAVGNADSGDGNSVVPKRDGQQGTTKKEGKEKEGEEQQEEEEEALVIEQPLLTIKEVFVYRVPPLRASSGHRAEEWGLANPVFTGVCVVRYV